MKKTVDAIGDACPIPVVKTKNAIKELNGPGSVETLVDNEIAVQNLTKMANQKGYAVRSEKIAEDQFRVDRQILFAADAEAGGMVFLAGGIDERRVEFPPAVLIGTVEAREIREAAYRHRHGITSKLIQISWCFRNHYSMTEAPVLSRIIECRQ